MRVVVDTNIFISAFLGSRLCTIIFDAFVDNEFHLILSPITFQELKATLKNPKFLGILNSKTLAETLLIIERLAMTVHPEIRVAVCRDIKDNMVLEAAITGRADFIITGDKDLLALKEFDNIPIITPKEFIAKLKKSKS